MRCVFAKGKTNERQLSGAVLRGSFVLPVQNAADFFSKGDLIFVSNADGSGAEFLGPAVSVSGNEIQCLFGLSAGRNAGASCWKPSSALMWQKERAMPARRSFDTGVEVRRSAGGVLYLTKLREAASSKILRFESLRKGDVALFTTWVEDVLGGGIEKFTFSDEERRVCVVALISSRIIQNEEKPEAVGIEMELERIIEGRYL